MPPRLLLPPPRSLARPPRASLPARRRPGLRSSPSSRLPRRPPGRSGSWSRRRPRTRSSRSRLPRRSPCGARSRGRRPPRARLNDATPHGAMTTPRAPRGKQTAFSVRASGRKPPMTMSPRLGFSAVRRMPPLPVGPATVVNSAEVPHFELREDPSFWMNNNVQVVVRVRPLNNTEKSLDNYNRCLKQESAQSITWTGQPETRFTFDHVACETVDQDALFRVAGLPMVENCMAGYNSCVLAYGQTGSGKTHTMFGEMSDHEVGPSPDRGMAPRIFESLFTRMRAEEESRRDENLKYTCKCSFLEIYNGQITDLFDPFSSSNLPLREDRRKAVYVENLTEFKVGCDSEIIKLLMQGSANRKVASTRMNRESSRSHSVFTCIVESRWEKDSTSNLRFARLNLVDLAGSERQRTSVLEDELLKEAGNINKSLSILSRVITSLVGQKNGTQKHIPYRDSKLTFLLQDSLGGNSKTVIVANISPSMCSANETLSTLKFANLARLIQNSAVVNEDTSEDVLVLQHQICLLKEELAVLKRHHVTRALSFAADESTGGDVDEGSEKNNNDAHNRSSNKQLERTNQELETCRSELQVCLESNRKLKREIADLQKESRTKISMEEYAAVCELERTNQELETCRSELQVCLESNRKQKREIADLQKESRTKISKAEYATVCEALELEVSTAKEFAVEKSFEAYIVLAKFDEAHATINDADVTVKALVEANETLKLQVERYKAKEASFIAEKNDMLSEINGLKMLLDTKKTANEALELKLHKLELQEQSFADILEKLKVEVTLWKIDQDLESIAVCTLHEENNKIIADLESLRKTSDEAMANLHAMNVERYKAKEASLISEKNDMLNEINSLKMLLDMKNHAKETLEKQLKLELQEQRIAFIDILEKLKAEATLWKIDQDLESIAMCTLHEENNVISTDLENLRKNSDEAMINLHAMNVENTKQKKALMELECSHATICGELELKTEAINLKSKRENDLSSENEILKQKILDILCKEQQMVELMANIEAHKSFVSIERLLHLVNDHVQDRISQQINMVSKSCNELDVILISAEGVGI